MRRDSIEGWRAGNPEFVPSALNIGTVVPTRDALVLVLSVVAVAMFVVSSLALRHGAGAPVTGEMPDDRAAPAVAPPFTRAS